MPSFTVATSSHHHSPSSKYPIIHYSIPTKMCISSNHAHESQSYNGKLSPRDNHLPSNYSRFLKVLYCTTTALCGMMLWWILIAPSSWLVGHSASHDRFIENFFQEDWISTPDVVFKYAGHPAIQFSHILPGFLWAGAIPFQLHPGFQKHYKDYHRRVGYVFLTTSLIMTVGVALIIQRGLVYPNDFPDLPPMDLFLDVEYCLVLLCLWFCLTILIAIQKAKVKDFVAHRKFIVRHVASGLWVALQRVILFCHAPFLPFTREQQRNAFHQSSFLGIAISLILGEVTVFLIRKEKDAKQGNKSL